MLFGSFEIVTLEAGAFKLDGGAMFGTVPKPLWEKAIPPDSLNRIPMALRLLLVRDHDSKRNLLIDTGIGEKWSPKLASLYAIDHSQHNLLNELAAYDLAPDDISDIVLTHLHFDHTGGSTYRTETGAIEPQFKNARYYIQKENWLWATAPNSRESASYLKENFMPVFEKGQMIICDGADDVKDKLQWPGFEVRVSHGHTVGLQCPLLSVGNEKFFYPSDLIPTSAHIPLPWVMGYDIHVIKILDEKEKILQEAARDRWIFVFEHDPVIKACRIHKGDKHFERGELIDLSRREP